MKEATSNPSKYTKRIIIFLGILSILLVAGCMPFITQMIPSPTSITGNKLIGTITKATSTVISQNIYAQSGRTFIYFESCFDLDKGSGAAKKEQGCDLMLQSSLDNNSEQLIFSPLGTARFALYEPFSSSPGSEQCRTTKQMSRDPETLSPMIAAYFCYQTGDGRYGYLRFKEVASNGVALEWHTYDTPIQASGTPSPIPISPTITEIPGTPHPSKTMTPTNTSPPFWTHSEGIERFIYFPDCFDLDQGVDSGSEIPACDFNIYLGPGGGYTQIEFVPYPPAQFAFNETLIEPPSYWDCRDAVKYSSEIATISPLEIAYMCYQTGDGRYGYLKFNYTSAEAVSLDWFTFDPAAEILNVAPVSTQTAPLDIFYPQGKAIWQDNFEDDHNWDLYQDEHTQFSIQNGQLQMTALNADNWDGWLLTWQKFNDFYVEANFNSAGCVGLNHYGLIVRANELNGKENGYLFNVSCNGYYSMGLRSEDGYTILIPWTASPTLKQSDKQSVRLGVMAQEDHLALFINGEWQADIEDKTISSGQFGPFISAVTTPGFSISVEDISYWVVQ